MVFCLDLITVQSESEISLSFLSSVPQHFALLWNSTSQIFMYLRSPWDVTKMLILIQEFWDGTWDLEIPSDSQAKRCCHRSKEHTLSNKGLEM